MITAHSETVTARRFARLRATARLGAVAAFCAALASAPAAFAQSSPARCDRACLDRVMATYLSALAARDSAAVPWAAQVRRTENGAEVASLDSLWKTGGRVVRSRVAIDAESQNVAAQILLDAGGRPTIALLRLGVADRRIAAVEAIVAREGEIGKDVFFDPGAFERAEQPEWRRDAPERATREELLRVVRTYFEALRTAGTAEFVNAAFAPDCDRFENGLQVTNVPFLGGPPKNCLDQVRDLSEDLRKAGDRVAVGGGRYPLVDEQKGIVLGVSTLRDELLVADLFKIEHGRLRTVQITYNRIPAGRGTGW